jgi:uncharacterized lipoprotein
MTPFFSKFFPQPRSVAGTALRTATFLVLAVAVFGTSGCRMFSKKHDLYGKSEAERPLEFPPAFNAEEAEAIYSGTASGSVTRSSVGTGGSSTSQALGFVVSGDRATVYERVGAALAKIEGANVVSRAQLLGAFDLDYEGSKFLVRVSEVAGGSQVAAVDPRGVAAQGAAPAKLIAQLKAAMGAK